MPIKLHFEAALSQVINGTNRMLVNIPLPAVITQELPEIVASLLDLTQMPDPPVLQVDRTLQPLITFVLHLDYPLMLPAMLLQPLARGLRLVNSPLHLD